MCRVSYARETWPASDVGRQPDALGAGLDVGGEHPEHQAQQGEQHQQPVVPRPGVPPDEPAEDGGVGGSVFRSATNAACRSGEAISSATPQHSPPRSSDSMRPGAAGLPRRHSVGPRQKARRQPFTKAGRVSPTSNRGFHNSEPIAKTQSGAPSGSAPRMSAATPS